MALFRCTQCGHLREVPNTYIGKSVRCPQCKQTAPIYDTVTFVDAVLKKYLAQYKELHELRQQLGTTQPEEQPSSDQQLLEDIDIYNTTALAQSQQYEPILQWFEQRQIQVEVNEKAIDTSGFFDEVALALGNDYELLQEVSEKIKRIQHKGYTNVKLPIAKKSQKQIQTITSFCQQLYDYSFVAKYFYQKPEKIVRLTLQTAPAIVSFFNGEWLEWFVLMKLLEFFREKQIATACLRNLSLTFPNEDRHELDVFFLVNGRLPICIECKSGEFRRDIEKYAALRQRLNLEKPQFLLCAAGLNAEKAQGLTSMYDVTFVNEHNFLPHVEGLV